jgi:NAD kinase
MTPITENKIILVVRATRLDELIARFNTREQAKFYIEHLGADFSDYEAEDEQYKFCVRNGKDTLSRLGRLQVVRREFVPNFIFGSGDTIVVLGQDGLVANVLKYLTKQPVLGVNPDPSRWEGVLLPFQVDDLESAVADVFAGKREIRKITMARADLNDGQVLYGVNDLFIGPQSHTSARYAIEIGGKSEYHSSSGIIVSTGLGSTGWLRSIVAGATGIASSLIGDEVGKDIKSNFPWDADHLYFSVREPWPSRRSSAEITFGKITENSPLYLTSQMPERGVIFSDGIEVDYLEFNSGTRAVITIAKKQGHLVI